MLRVLSYYCILMCRLLVLNFHRETMVISVPMASSTPIILKREQLVVFTKNICEEGDHVPKFRIMILLGHCLNRNFNYPVTVFSFLALNSIFSGDGSIAR